MARNGRAAHRYMAYRRRQRNGHGMPRWLTALVVLGGAIIVLMGIVAGVGFGVYQSYANNFVPPDVAIAQQPRGGARILDRNGKLLYEYLDDASGLREPVKIDDIAFYLVLATVATEDSSFFSNPGVNFKGVTAAAIDNFLPFGKPGFLEGRGGSSITQQLVKNVYFTPQERSKRSASRKIKETVYALELTKRYSKRQILEWYLNQISYGNVFVGIQTASRGYFGKDAKDLTLDEAATLAGIPACPSCYDPLADPDSAVARRNYVLRRMYDEHYIDLYQLYTAALTPLKLLPQRFSVDAPHFVFNVVQPQLEAIFGADVLKHDGLVVYTTLDSGLQDKAQAILNNWVDTFGESSGGHNGAVVAMDPSTAQVLAYIGSRDYFDEAIQGQNDMADALNSPGSSFKPVTYVTAFMKLGWGPGTLILDAPIPSKYWDGKNPPRNPVAHSGPITARDALGNSLNIPAIKTILYTGVDNVIEQAKKMGITTLDGRQLGPSMTVGGVDVKLNDMVYAYTAFPNLGVQRGIESSVSRPPGNRALDPISILRVEDRDGKILWPMVDGQPAQEPVPQEVRVAPAQESYEINSILSDPNAFCLTYGCGGLSIGRPAAFKTGTSEPYEQIGLIGDTWTFGYTPQIVVGSWFGNADNSPMHNISSASVSYRTVRDVLLAYLEDKPVEQFQQPGGLLRGSVCMPSGLLPTPACPIVSPEDWFARLPDKADDWWTTARIDTRTNKLATDSTPAQFVQEQRYLRIPDSVTGIARDDAIGWQYISGTPLGTAPTEPSQATDLPGTITSPADGDSLRGTVTITGRATSAHFVSYRLEYQSDATAGDWTPITESATSVEQGRLGQWHTGGLPSGSYNLRLVIVDAERGDIVADQIQVSIGGRAATPTQASPTDTPEPQREHRGHGP